MQSFILETLLSNGSGYVSSFLLTDFLCFALLIYITISLILPALRNYRLAKSLDLICGTDAKHWFYGHTQKYGNSPEGLLNSSERTRNHPFFFNEWVGPLIQNAFLHNPRTSSSLLRSSAPKNETGYRVMRPWIGDGLLTSSGSKWRRNRKLLTPAFHYNILKPYVTIYNHCASVLIEKWEKEVGKATEISEPISLMALDTMLQCAMSFKTDCQHPEGNHPYIAAVKDLATMVIKRISMPILLIDWIFYLTSYGKTFRKAADTVHTLAEEIISSRREKLHQRKEVEESERRKKVLDFLDILLETKDEDGNGLTDAEIRDEVDTFLFEGHDTTASGLSWIFYNLAKYPDLQEKCREEVICQIGEKDNVEWEDLSELPYLTMFIKESMRLYPPVPAIGRYLKEPLTVSVGDSKKTTIPSGSNVAVQIFAQHRNPHVWEDPERFDPERFTLENISKRSSHAYIPFSAGPRNCIGQNFAMNETKVVTAQVLRKFQLYLDNETPEAIMKPLLILWSENGIFVKFKLRGRA